LGLLAIVIDFGVTGFAEGGEAECLPVGMEESAGGQDGFAGNCEIDEAVDPLDDDLQISRGGGNHMAMSLSDRDIGGLEFFGGAVEVVEEGEVDEEGTVLDKFDDSVFLRFGEKAGAFGELGLGWQGGEECGGEEAEGWYGFEQAVHGGLPWMCGWGDPRWEVGGYAVSYRSFSSGGVPLLISRSNVVSSGVATGAR
jgi:hypothetical protein